MKLRIQSLAVVLLGTLALAACADNGPTSPATRGPDLAKSSKVDVCHRTGGHGYNLINVAAAAVPAHLGHGDLLVGPLPDHSGFVGSDCTVLAIALVPGTTLDTDLANPTANAAPFTDACPTGSVAVGLTGNAGEWFGWASHWNVALICRELLADGTLGATTVLTPHGGGDGNTNSTLTYSVSCPSGQVLVGGTGTWGIGLSSFVGNCATVARVTAGTGGYDSTIGPLNGSGAGLPGGDRPTDFSAVCPAGYAATGLIGKEGVILDSVGFQCTKVVVQAAA
jgi:hypothetical protein